MPDADAAPDPAAPRLLIALTLASALSPLNSTSMAVAIPSVSREFGAPPATLTQWLVTSYLVVGIVAQSPCGKLGDLFGYRRALALGQAVFALGTIAALMAPSAGVLVLARVLMAAGGAAIVPSAVALVREVVPAPRRGRAYGLFGASMGIAAALGPLLGGELVARFGWRAVFAVNAPLLVASALLARAPRRVVDAVAGEVAPAATRPRFDAVGSVLLGAGLAVLVLGARGRNAWAAAGGAAVLWAFVAWERRVAAPVVDPRLFLRRTFTAGALVVALQNLAMYALLFELPLFFAHARGLGADQSGRALIAMMATMVVATPVGARLAERFGPRATVVLGGALATAGMLALRDAGAIRAPSDVFPALVALGAGLGLSSAPSQAAAMAAVEPRDAGMAAGVYSTVRYLGGVAGIAILGAVLTGRDAASLLAQHPRATTFFAASLAAATLCAFGLPHGRAAGEPAAVPRGEGPGARG